MNREDYEKARVDVTVLLPAYNESEAIEKVIDDVRRAMSGVSLVYEVLVVDDASSDNTYSLASKKGVRCIRRPENGGSGASRKTGILSARGDIIVMLDADGSYNAADIPNLLECFPEFDQVNGARTKEKGTMRFLRVPAKWMIRMLASYLAGRLIPDLNTGLKAFKREHMIPYLWVIPNGFSCVTSMTLAFLCNGHPVKYVPTEYYERIGKSKFHPITDTFRYLQTVIRLTLFFRPMRIFLPLAVITGLAGVARSLLNRFYVGHMQLSDIAILVLATTLFLIGMIAEFVLGAIRSINQNVNAAKQHILAEIQGKK